MKILLVQPAKSSRTIGGEDYHIYEPLALEYLAAPLLEEHEVEILDMRLDPDLDGVLLRWCPDVVGLTAYTAHVNTVRRLCRRIKEHSPQVLTVVGGHHATVAPEDFQIRSIDVVVRGEGVLPFREIIRRYEKSENLEGIPGVGYEADGRWIQQPFELATDLDALPFPARGLTDAYRQHYFAEWMRPLASIRTSKGCPFRCKFCALWKLTGGHYLKRDPAKIVEELGAIREKYVFFADDESLVDAKRMMTLARLIREAGIQKRYFLYGRSDTIAKHPELLAQWKEIGLERIFVGLEFFCDRDLDFVGKGSTESDNREAVRILHDLELEIYASFVVRPEFTRADFAAFIDYCRGLDLNFASFSVLTPLPGTDFYEEVRDDLLTEDYEYFDFIHTVLPTRLPIEDFYRQYKRLYQKAVPLRNGLSLLAKFPVRQWPLVFRKSAQWYRTLGRIHRDYAGLGVSEDVVESMGS